MSKNTAVQYNGVRINIVDTPGHADFGGEVERILKWLTESSFWWMLKDPCLKLVSKLRKALNLNLKPIVVINKLTGRKPELVRLLTKYWICLLNLKQMMNSLISCCIRIRRTGMLLLKVKVRIG